MFDFGFWELLLVMLVALVVVGPQRLPKLAAQIGEWIGRMRRLVNQFKHNVQQELQTEELREAMRQQQNEIQELRDLVQDQKSPGTPALRAVEDALKSNPTPASDSSEHEPPERQERD